MYTGRTKVSTQVDEFPPFIKSFLFQPTVCPKVILKSAQSAAVSFSAIHNNTSKRDLSCHAKISVKVPLSLLLALQAEVAVGLLFLSASLTVTCWFHRSETGCLPRVTGGYQT